jgi:Mor family transcriptional regulator
MHCRTVSPWGTSIRRKAQGATLTSSYERRLRWRWLISPTMSVSSTRMARNVVLKRATDDSRLMDAMIACDRLKKQLPYVVIVSLSHGVLLRQDTTRGIQQREQKRQRTALKVSLMYNVTGEHCFMPDMVQLIVEQSMNILYIAVPPGASRCVGPTSRTPSSRARASTAGVKPARANRT